ncbi:FimV family protein [Acinetobacter sp. BSP-28]|uniref:type IV pilus assembly protein FimV n=1 Tax=Acinetobacter sp. BSP-28 TaxID=3344661 RepID=UPI00377045D7
MTVYNKLKIAILAIIASQNIHAITIDPIQIQSAPGELLYAEMNFRQADPHTPIQASLANAEDITTLGVVHQPPGHLNFFTRRDSSGNGVITITSSRPLTEAELNIIIKIQEGNSTRLQHIKTPLQRSPAKTQARILGNEKPLNPITIVSEKDIALQLPESTQYRIEKPQAALQQSFEAPLMVHKAAPPSLNSTSAASVVISAMQMPSTQPVQTPQNAPAEAKSAIPAQISTKNEVKTSNNSNNNVSADPLVKQYAASAQQAKSKVAAETVAPAAPKTKPETAAKPSSQPGITAQASKHVVQSNESLWAIASRVATEQNRPIGEVMKQIKANNEHAFIQGDVNRLRRGAALNLNTVGNPKEEHKPKVAHLAKAPSNPSHQSAKAKYRLNQAEMSLVAEKEQDSASGSAKKNTEKKQTSNELSLKVMTSREKTVRLQRNVTQLELALNQKDHRIQLLNARLAQLQQQLKAQQADKKPIH